MIDTIALTIESGYKITKFDKFSPSARGLFEPPYIPFGNQPFLKSIQNPNKKDIEETGYKPRLTITKRRFAGSHPSLRVELSLPKLIFGNNFQEITDENFKDVLSQLQYQLLEMGVSVPSIVLENAKVSAIHYSKNILLSKGITVPLILDEIAKADTSAFLDRNKTDYRNDGHCFKLHCNSYEITFYDKVKDIEQAQKSEKKAIEEENFPQLELFKNIKEPPRQVLRMEVRLGNSRKIKQIINQLKIDTELTFKGLYSEYISKKVLLDFWGKIRASFPRISGQRTSVEDIFRDLVASNKIKTLKALEIAAILAIQSEVGGKACKVLLSATGANKQQRIRILTAASKAVLSNKHKSVFLSDEITGKLERFEVVGKDDMEKAFSGKLSVFRPEF